MPKRVFILVSYFIFLLAAFFRIDIVHFSQFGAGFLELCCLNLKLYGLHESKGESWPTYPGKPCLAAAKLVFDEVHEEYSTSLTNWTVKKGKKTIDNFNNLTLSFLLSIRLSSLVVFDIISTSKNKKKILFYAANWLPGTASKVTCCPKQVFWGHLKMGENNP